MFDEETVRLAAAIAEHDGRFAAAQRLAAHVGASVLLILVDEEIIDAWLPAQGFPQTLPGGRAWRDFLSSARQPGRHRGTLGYPNADQLTPALGYVDSGVLLIFLGAGTAPGRIEGLRSVLPLIASTLRAEQAAAAARGEQRAALNHAREAQALAVALDAARAQLERTLVKLEGQTRALEEARSRAEDAGRAKDEFLAMLGHELRNPLSPIVTALQLLRLKNQTTREHEIIERQVSNLMRLVDDLLDVSRITRGKVELKKQRIELAEVAARAIEMASPLLEKNRQVLAVDIPTRGLVVDADPARLAQVLANLLTNAAKYSDAETRIVFAAEQDETHVRIRVLDEGIGIGPEMLARVFDLFEQQRQSIARSQGGLGLGLAIVRSLVTVHGGTVRVFSEGEGRGSEFVVELPRAVGEAPRPEASRARTASPSDAAGRRVLVVDDNEDALALMSEALTAVGFEVRTAHNGLAALRIAETFACDVAVLDIGLPVMDGYEVAERLRRVEGRHAVSLVAVSGYGQEADKLRSESVGFDAHLVKPISLEDLQDTLCSLPARAG